MLRLMFMVEKIGNILGDFKKVHTKEGHRNRRFLRIQVKMELKRLLKRGTVVRFKEKRF